MHLFDGRLVAYNNYFQSGDNNLTISRGSGNIFSDTSPLNSETSASDDYSLKNTSSAIGTGIFSITLNGTTTGGGAIGDYVEVIDIASNQYSVSGMVTCAAGSNIATMFSATVS